MTIKMDAQISMNATNQFARSIFQNASIMKDHTDVNAIADLSQKSKGKALLIFIFTFDDFIVYVHSSKGLFTVII